MADQQFNIAKGAVSEKVRDATGNLIVLLLESNETESDLIDHDDLAAMLGATGNTEASFTNYARKTGLTGSVTVDDGNDRVDVDVADQTWTSAGNGTNETLTKAVVAYEDSAADSGRVPMTHHDFAVTTDGSDLSVEFNSAGFARTT